MNWAIALSLAGLVGGSFWRLASQFARLIELQTQLREKINLCLVGIEASGLIDRETTARIQLLEQRVSDLERYLQVSTARQDQPFLLRHNGPNSRQ